MVTTPSVDPQKLQAVRKRYAEEAKKRQRPEGSAQFLQLSQAHEERLRSLSDDPWADHKSLNAKPSIIRENAVYKAFVLGAGFGGLLFSIRLIESGVATANDIRLVDAAGGFGGTWYWNRYPGLHCDLESYMYLPLLEETGYIPKHKYSAGSEIRQHAERIASKWNLTDKALFRTTVKTVSWDDDTELWTVNFVEGRGPSAAPIEHQIRAQYVYLAAGVLTRPQVPRIPGLHTFSGEIFHTARWNYDITGGSQEDQTLSKLRDKRVAVVGTAATAIGVIPVVGKYAKELYVIQRTPAYVKPRNQQVTNKETFHIDVAYKKGWQFERQCNWNSFLTNSAEPGQKNLVGDGWTDMPGYSAMMGSPSHGVVDPSPENLERRTTAFHALDLPHMEAVRARVEQAVKDPETAEKLKPWYPSWCKRPTFSDTYLELFNEPHVHLVDTDGKGPSRITERSIVVSEKEYEVDVIIFSTGFQVARVGSPASRTNTTVTGRKGQSLDEKWAKVGAATLHGYLTNGFPNLFFSGTSQGTITGNNIMMLNFIANHITYMISSGEKRVGKGKRAIVEVTREAEEAHSAQVAKRAPYFSSVAGCTPGYFNGYGDGVDVTDPEEKGKRERGVVWSEGTISFLKLIGDWKKEGSLKGLKILPARELAYRAVL
ncbi:FAD/NAD(P)-binding domain-containing protein [Massarina eburnea CBS 473.64]|uniref:FAD/NAD(P)-binding domain-containing protein n=1 Tax=Massarina eburnea CBS 473.64 TaxID=1395130 RepID=A0A6A6SGB7_9PLEO|nr:FAD/NAD(P)-binding domain-containing protein [Massarina eburnea CBS 473.64]